MQALITHERSGIICAALLAAGVDAWSCDTSPAEPSHPCPERHLQADALDVLQSHAWRFAMSHPECTYLCASGLHWNRRRPERAELTERALQHVRDVMAAAAHIPLTALENPRGCIGTRIAPSSQTLQPYQYGHDASKATCLWLRGLPPLTPTAHVAPRAVCSGCGACERGDLAAPMLAGGCAHCGAPAKRVRPRWGNQTDSGQNALPPGANRWMDRSRTYQGIADAIAAQWAPIILNPVVA